MPITIKCRECGKTLLDMETIPPMNPQKDFFMYVKEKVGESCSYCGHHLRYFPVEVEVSILPNPTKKEWGDSNRKNGIFKHTHCWCYKCGEWIPSARYVIYKRRY